MGRGRQTYSICATCGGWVYDWKLERSGGWCNKCQSVMPGWKSMAPGTAAADKGKSTGKGPPWRKPTAVHGTLAELSSMLERVESLTAQMAPQVDLGPVKAVQSQVQAAAAAAAPKKEVSKELELRQAINKLNRCQLEVDSSAAALQEAEDHVLQLRTKNQKAIEDAADAVLEHKRALAAYQAETVCQDPEPPQQADWQAPAVGDLFDDLDEYEEEDKAKLVKFKADMEALDKLLQAAAGQFRKFSELKQQADRFRRQAQKKRKTTEDETKNDAQEAQEQKRERKEVIDKIKQQAEHKARGAKAKTAPAAYRDAAHKFITEEGKQKDIIMMCETHVDRGRLEQVREVVARDGWKLQGTAAVPTKRSEKGTTGGEFILARTHLACTGYDLLRKRIVDNGDVDPFRGFAALNVHTRSGNVILISAYL
ncbi:unnamed protein product, partial [Prorocentrum cordatum]